VKGNNTMRMGTGCGGKGRVPRLIPPNKGEEERMIKETIQKKQHGHGSKEETANNKA
jgi:hypothetical protein